MYVSDMLVPVVIWVQLHLHATTFSAIDSHPPGSAVGDTSDLRCLNELTELTNELTGS